MDAAFTDHRIAAARQAWGLDSGVVVVAAGEPASIAGTDQHHPFHAHPDFSYLGGVGSPSAVLAIDLATAETAVFEPHPSRDDRVWHADERPAGRPLAELDDWVGSRSAGRVFELGATEEPATALRAALDELRVVKDAVELDAMRRAAAATAAGFAALTRAVEPGLTERQLRSVIEGGFGFHGGDRPAYASIVAGGPNAAVLHFSPSDRPVGDSEFLLVDAGARVDGYACDVTRTWVVGAASERHRNLWHVVRSAQQLAIERCVAGTEYRDIHLATARDMAAGLVEVGILRGDPSDLVMRGVMAVFFPHGVGHLIGLNVHDVAGYAPGRERTDVGGTRFLRTDRILDAGMVVTIEPGIYFIDALLDDDELRQHYAADIAWDEVARYRGIGGVRIEDTVHVTDGEPEVLSGAIPKTLEV